MLSSVKSVQTHSYRAQSGETNSLGQILRWTLSTRDSTELMMTMASGKSTQKQSRIRTACRPTAFQGIAIAPASGDGMRSTGNARLSGADLG